MITSQLGLQQFVVSISVLEVFCLLALDIVEDSQVFFAFLLDLGAVAIVQNTPSVLESKDLCSVGCGETVSVLHLDSRQ